MANQQGPVEGGLRLRLWRPKVLDDLVADLEKRLNKQRSGTLLLIQIMRISVSSTQASLKQIENLLSASEALLTKGNR